MRMISKSILGVLKVSLDGILTLPQRTYGALKTRKSAASDFAELGRKINCKLKEETRQVTDTM